MLFQTLHDGVELVGRKRLVGADAKRHVIRSMLIMRDRGYTDSEIAAVYGFSREWVNKLINRAPRDVVERLVAIGLVRSRADVRG